MTGIADNAPDGSADSGTGKLTAWPSEHPTNKQVSDWLKINEPRVNSRFGPLMRGETPPHLISFTSGEVDLTGYVEIAAATPDAQGMNASQIMRHNVEVRKARAKAAELTRCLEDGKRAHKDQLAQDVIMALQPNAPLLLARLTQECKIMLPDPAHPRDPTRATDSKAIDGKLMFERLMAMRGHAGMHEETRDHDRAVERMRDTRLEDKCHADDFAYKVNKLLSEHVDHLERKLE